MTAVREEQGTEWAEWVAWSLAFLVAAVLLVASRFQSPDGDTTLHVLIVTHLAKLPMNRWIAPEWWGGMNGKGLYREHPVGIFLLPALLGKLGYPAAEAPFLANALYEILTLVLVQRVVAVLVTPIESRSLAWLLQFMPIAFVYRIRANHEQAVWLCLLVALWGTERSRGNGRWIALTVIGAVGMLLVKGLFVVFVFAGCVLWLVTVRRREGMPRSADVRAWLGVGIAAIAVVAVVAGYESLYRHVTQESFLAVYLGRQIGAAGLHQNGSLILRKLYNLGWYTARILWFPFPASLAAIAAAWACRKSFVDALLGRPMAGAGSAKMKENEGVVFTTGLALVYLFVFSFSDRATDRYIFPAYYLVGACGMIAAMHVWGPFRRLAERVDRYHQIFPAAVWIFLFVLTLAAKPMGLPRVALWPRG